MILVDKLMLTAFNSIDMGGGQMSNKNKYKKDSAVDSEWLTKIGLISFLILATCGGSWWVYEKAMAGQRVKKTHETFIQVSNAAQKYVDLNGSFKMHLTKENEQEILSAIAGKYLNNLKSPYKDDVNIGVTSMSGKKNGEFFITVKGVPKKECEDMIGKLNATFPLLAIGQHHAEAVGAHTGMYVKNKFGNREYNEEFSKITCRNESVINGKVNITAWVFANTELKINDVSVEQYNHTEK